MQIDANSFRTVMAHYPTGVCIVTAVSPDGQAFGMTVGTFTSVSLEPPLIGFFPDKKSTSWPAIAAAGRFCVNVLAADQQSLCRKFAARGGDKFAEVIHRVSEHGLPVLDGCVAWIECSVHAVHEAGDHLFVLGDVIAMAADNGKAASPLLFFQGRFGQIASIEAAA